MRGFQELEITGWIERPAYSSQTHQFIWSAGLRNKGEAGGAQTVNYNTFLLGREGYFSLNFVTGANLIETEKPIARSLLAAMHFTTGKRYDDFNASTDKVAAYGLAALVGGAVLKKAGILAVVTAFVAKFAKVFLVLGGVLVVGIFNLLRRRPSGKA